MFCQVHQQKEKMGQTKTTFAVHPRQAAGSAPWESDCAYVDGQLRHLAEWVLQAQAADTVCWCWCVHCS